MSIEELKQEGYSILQVQRPIRFCVNLVHNLVV